MGQHRPAAARDARLWQPFRARVRACQSSGRLHGQPAGGCLRPTGAAIREGAKCGAVARRGSECVSRRRSQPTDTVLGGPPFPPTRGPPASPRRQRNARQHERREPRPVRLGIGPRATASAPGSVAPADGGQPRWRRAVWCRRRPGARDETPKSTGTATRGPARMRRRPPPPPSSPARSRDGPFLPGLVILAARGARFRGRRPAGRPAVRGCFSRYVYVSCGATPPSRATARHDPRSPKAETSGVADEQRAPPRLETFRVGRLHGCSRTRRGGMGVVYAALTNRASMRVAVSGAPHGEAESRSDMRGGGKPRIRGGRRPWRACRIRTSRHRPTTSIVDGEDSQSRWSSSKVQSLRTWLRGEDRVLAGDPSARFVQAAPGLPLRTTRG